VKLFLTNQSNPARGSTSSFQRILAAAALTAALASPAAAQVVGTYTGSAADGSYFSVTVAVDSATSLYEIVGASVDFTAPCKGTTGYVLNSGWGFNPEADITNHAVTVNDDFNYSSIAFNLKFDNTNNTVTGFVSVIAPTLYEVGIKPKKVLICTSRKQPLGATYTSSPNQAPSRGPVIQLHHVPS
jgi:hypothetical protein